MCLFWLLFLESVVKIIEIEVYFYIILRLILEEMIIFFFNYHIEIYLYRTTVILLVC